MDKTFEPGALLYACTGALIGIFATLMVPPVGVPHFPGAITPLSLTSLAEEVTLAEPDPISWTEDVQGVARAAMGLAVHTVKVRGGDTLALPRIVNFTTEFYRPPGLVETKARAEIVRRGRRLAVLRAMAWQADPARPVAGGHGHVVP